MPTSSRWAGVGRKFNAIFGLQASASDQDWLRRPGRVDPVAVVARGRREPQIGIEDSRAGRQGSTAGGRGERDEPRYRVHRHGRDVIRDNIMPAHAPRGPEPEGRAAFF
jgi:hypothetical protein